MKAIFLLATLKGPSEVSNTEALSMLLALELEKLGAETEIVKLAEFRIPPGTKTDMGAGDDWPKILARVLASEILIFATPVWWGIQSSLMQRGIERMDELNDKLLSTGKSDFANKIGGIVITGGEDGAQHIIGNICNFMSWNGLTIPPACSLSFLGNPEGETLAARQQSMVGQDKKLVAGARVMAGNLVFFANLLRQNPMPQ